MKKVAICGLSNRALNMFIEPIVHLFSGKYTIVGLLDVDPLRDEICKRKFPILQDVPFFHQDQFKQMISETGAETIIVAGRDDTHFSYIIEGLRSNLDVITEKPMVTNVEDALKVLEEESKSEGTVYVTFNYRYSPIHRKIKEMIMEGKLGRITSIELNWMLDTYHGASYFKRWNRSRQYSGGLSIHKSSHHFDLVNWWIDQNPVEVFSFGNLHYYGSNGELNPSKVDGRHCETCSEQGDCHYYMRWNTRSNQAEVKDDHLSNKDSIQNSYSDYRPDACIFDSEIDIEDTYVATVKYDKGSLLSYSVNFSSPYEGYKLAINGTKGRLETTEFHEPSRIPFPIPEQQTIDYFPLFGSKETIYVVHTEGGHGGGDPLLLEDLFLGPNPARQYDILAGARAGYYSIAVGEGVWRSSMENRPIYIKEIKNKRS
ncbi:Gfo/Idh/MocA family protein [Sutcliffiella rhizosphaerae]|uniref:Oxidoreductase YteT n=1 Tax=Sutcliffiella rhizosphaerae TaxID=2880967 RepID=A0ABM8YLW9_9BACI|nr:Gfo/Idh/MocA family oxidoreductase [Sutcliffiella rhizosphaerae]CAG9620944.1 Putative oxidoreductase YteT [Sutcliffiella rhizosphaerae]